MRISSGFSVESSVIAGGWGSSTASTGGAASSAGATSSAAGSDISFWSRVPLKFAVRSFAKKKDFEVPKQMLTGERHANE